MIRTLVVSLALANAALAEYKFEPLRHLAGIAPYFEPADPPLDPKPPQGCNVTRAAYLVRHAAIYANDFDFEEYIEPFTDKLQNASVDWSKAGPLSFLKDWKTPIEDEDLEEVTKVGEKESQDLGSTIKSRYQGFKMPKKVWTSTAERTVKSAEYFVQGMSNSTNDTEVVQVPESKAEGADSLTPYKGCPKYKGSTGSTQSSAYKSIYTKPLLERFHALAPGFNWTADDIVGMQELCGYETVIRGSSPFCELDVFSPDDWLMFEYMQDIQYHYNAGYGQPIAAPVGFPWLNATAKTLLADTADQDLYVSFTHRELPPMVLVAMGLFNNSAFTGTNNPNATMPLSTPNHYRQWKASHILPFLANIAIEKMTCDSYGYDAGDYLRVLVNRVPQQLPNCGDGPGESCSKTKFQKYVTDRALVSGPFTANCEPEYKNSTDYLSIYGQ